MNSSNKKEKFQCVFCYTNINESDMKNSLIEVHYCLSQNKCPLLNSPQTTHNSPREGTNFDLLQLITNSLPLGYDTHQIYYDDK